VQRKKTLVDNAVLEIRPTIDIDLSVEVVTLFELYGFDIKKLKNGVA
jgi:hypothetical protein